jgi:hypothetical protein
MQLEHHNQCKQLFKLQEQNQKLVISINNKIIAFKRQLIKEHFNRLKGKEGIQIKTTLKKNTTTI